MEATLTVAFAEGAVTRLRREFKLVVSQREAAEVCARLHQELGAPPCATQITSIYFDRPGLPLARRAQTSPDDCLKIRTKEYAPDLSGGELPRVVFEVKRERNGLTRKRRVWLPRTELHEVLAPRRNVVSELPEDGAMIPVVAVTYVREVYQRSAAWRITVDRDIRYHAVDPAVALGSQKVSVERLGPTLGCEPRVVIEVKHLGAELPSWVESLRAGRGTHFSKFAEGVARLSAGNQVGVREG